MVIPGQVIESAHICSLMRRINALEANVPITFYRRSDLDTDAGMVDLYTTPPVNIAQVFACALIEPYMYLIRNDTTAQRVYIDVINSTGSVVDTITPFEIGNSFGVNLCKAWDAALSEWVLLLILTDGTRRYIRKIKTDGTKVAEYQYPITIDFRLGSPTCQLTADETYVYNIRETFDTGIFKLLTQRFLLTDLSSVDTTYFPSPFVGNSEDPFIGGPLILDGFLYVPLRLQTATGLNVLLKFDVTNLGVVHSYFDFVDEGLSDAHDSTMLYGQLSVTYHNNYLWLIGTRTVAWPYVVRLPISLSTYSLHALKQVDWTTSGLAGDTLAFARCSEGLVLNPFGNNANLWATFPYNMLAFTTTPPTTEFSKYGSAGTAIALGNDGGNILPNDAALNLGIKTGTLEIGERAEITAHQMIVDMRNAIEALTTRRLVIPGTISESTPVGTFYTFGDSGAYNVYSIATAGKLTGYGYSDSVRWTRSAKELIGTPLKAIDVAEIEMVIEELERSETYMGLL